MAGEESFDAAEVARKEFGSGFRGFDQYEVRAYLAKLAGHLAVLEERERGLRERLADLERLRPPSDRELADEEIEQALGKEATKVIHAAREAAAEMRTRTEENVARLLREAQDQAQAIRSEAAELLSRRTEEADAAAAGIVEAAQQRGREMVAEAQAVRERMLRDLARRRRQAETQVQLLLAGRERLLDALRRAAEGAGSAIEEVARVELGDLPELEPQGDGPGGPAAERVPAAAGPEGRPGPAPTAVAADPGVDTGEPSGPHPSAGVAPRARPVTDDDRRPPPLRLLRRRPEPASDVDLDDDVEGVRIIRPDPDPEPAEASPAETAGVPGSGDVAEPVEEAEEEAEADRGEPSDPAPSTDGSSEGSSGGAPTPPRPVEDLFARLHADREAAMSEASEASEVSADDPAAGPATEGDVAAGAEPSAEPAPADGEEAPDRPGDTDAGAPVGTDGVDVDLGGVAVAEDTPFEARDAALADAERALTRSLKRALADEQNEVLDALRRLKGRPRIEVLLPNADVHRSRYQRVGAGPLGTAASAGAASVGGEAATPGEAGAGDEQAGAFAEEVSSDLRQRVERALDAGTGDAEQLAGAVSAAYREWKVGRAEEVARHHLAAAYSAAVYAAVPDGLLAWVVDPAEGGCPDCDDNALAGPTRKGAPYPTGQQHPPAHAGCRCLLAAPSAG